MTGEAASHAGIRLPEFTGAQYADGIERYLETGQAQRILRPRQLEVFTDFQHFFANDYRRGYVTMPTGTGKTVLFVELSKAIMHTRNEHGDTPHILVTSPLQDLVMQTLGQSGEEPGEKRRGYGGFAPDLKVGTFYGQSRIHERQQEALMATPVVLTTYVSFARLAASSLLRRMTAEEQERNSRILLASSANFTGGSFANFGQQFTELYNQLSQEEMISLGHNLLSLFQVHILDEGHHAMEGRTRRILEEDMNSAAQVLAFTASPKRSRKLSLDSVLPHKIHELDIKEAVNLEMLAPLAPIAVASNNKITGEDLFDENGEFIEEKIAYLKFSEPRNKLLVDLAETLTKRGIGTVVNCIAGGDAWHPEHIAQQLRARGIKAQAIHYNIPPAERREYYKAFERGDIDVLTYIGILAEGWDSDRAKALVNGRPVRSRITAIQRLGRILRPGELAYVFDVVDRLEDLNPIFTVADIFEDGDIELGSIIGDANEKDKAILSELLKEVASVATIQKKVRADHNRFDELLADYPNIQDGELMDATLGSFRTAHRLSRQYPGLSPEMLEAVARQTGQEVPMRFGNQNSTLNKTYSTKIGLKMLRELPVTDPAQFFVDQNGRWITAYGMPAAFGKAYPDLDVEKAKDVLEQLSGSQKWCVVQSREALPSPVGNSHRYQLHKAFQVNEEFISAVKQELEAKQ